MTLPLIILVILSLPVLFHIVTDSFLLPLWCLISCIIYVSMFFSLIVLTPYSAGVSMWFCGGSRSSSSGYQQVVLSPLAGSCRDATPWWRERWCLLGCRCCRVWPTYTHASSCTKMSPHATVCEYISVVVFGWFENQFLPMFFLWILLYGWSFENQFLIFLL